ncbi:MAG: hypothetical protein OEV44_13100 [Spirochaetota bacterium]|nr:hypothetical protein [Spirochaetota bacterium]
MILRRGNIDDLSGNAVVYWEVVGENKVAPGFSIFAINFVVSSIPLENKLLTATFPPVPFRDYEELLDKCFGIKCDVLYGGNIVFPDGDEGFNKFYKSEFAKFNKTVEEYVDIYKEKFNFSIERLSERDKLYMLKDLSQKARIDVREKNNSKRLNSTKIKQIIDDLQYERKYDISNFQSILHLPGEIGDQLVTLYTEKFLAIFHEDYENANILKREIFKLEKEVQNNQ